MAVRQGQKFKHIVIMKKLESIKHSKFDNLKFQELKDLRGIVGGGGPYELTQASTTAGGVSDTVTWTFAGDGTTTHQVDKITTGPQ